MLRLFLSYSRSDVLNQVRFPRFWDYLIQSDYEKGAFDEPIAQTNLIHGRRSPDQRTAYDQGSFEGRNKSPAPPKGASDEETFRAIPNGSWFNSDVGDAFNEMTEILTVNSLAEYPAGETLQTLSSPVPVECTPGDTNETFSMTPVEYPSDITSVACAPGMTIDLLITVECPDTGSVVCAPCGENFSHDADSQRTTVTDLHGNSTTTTYDTDASLTSVTDPLGHTTFAYDTLFPVPVECPSDNMSVECAPGGELYVYAVDGQLTTITDLLGNTTTMTYDANGNITSVTDPLGNTTTYRYTFADHTFVEDGSGMTIQVADDGVTVETGTTALISGPTSGATIGVIGAPWFGWTGFVEALSSFVGTIFSQLGRAQKEFIRWLRIREAKRLTRLTRRASGAGTKEIVVHTLAWAPAPSPASRTTASGTDSSVVTRKVEKGKGTLGKDRGNQVHGSFASVGKTKTGSNSALYEFPSRDDRSNSKKLPLEHHSVNLHRVSITRCRMNPNTHVPVARLALHA